MSALFRLPRQRHLLFFALSILFAAPLAADVGDWYVAGESRSERATVELILPEAAFPSSGRLAALLRFRLDPGWHLYWKNPGDSGMPPKVVAVAPESLKIDYLGWPVPERIDTSPLMSYGHYGTFTLPLELTLPEEALVALASGDAIDFHLQLDWLECDEICLPGDADFPFSLSFKEGEALQGVAFAELRQATLRHLPRRFGTVLREGSGDIELSVSDSSERLRLVVELPQSHFSESPLESIYYFVEPTGIVQYSTAQEFTFTEPSELDRHRFELTIVRDVNATESPMALPGVLELSFADGRKLFWQIDEDDFATAGASLAAGERGLLLSLLIAFALALLGGLLLNLMPCVLPVLSLKVFHIIEANDGERGRALRHAFGYTLGVVVSFLLLAFALLLFRLGGEELGWGFQLQSPRFLAFLAIFITLFALSMAGLYEISLALPDFLQRWGAGGGLVAQNADGADSSGHKKSTLAGAVMTGVVAVLVATPCTAPFMGSAVGYALTGPVVAIPIVFSGLGLGMAAPILLLSAFPQLMRFMPRPGRWMESLKQLLSFPLFATVIWLLWLYSRQMGGDALAILLFALLLVALAVWIYGRFGHRLIAAPRRQLFQLFSLLFLALALWLTFSVAPLFAVFAPPPAALDRSAGATTAAAGEWEPFHADRVAELRREGRMVFINFTADWCLTCKLNERTSFADASVKAAFAEHNVALLKADWTQSDAHISAELARFGRSGVPFYLLYPADGSQPLQPPELLTAAILRDYIERAAARSR